jgi:hypothetical protein
VHSMDFYRVGMGELNALGSPSAGELEIVFDNRWGGEGHIFRPTDHWVSTFAIFCALRSVKTPSIRRPRSFPWPHLQSPGRDAGVEKFLQVDGTDSNTSRCSRSR